MLKFSLEALGRELLDRAATAGAGHTADTVVGGHERVQRQTFIALVKGCTLAEHENPGEATVHVLSGRVRRPPASCPGRAVSATCSSSPIRATAWRRRKTRQSC